MSEMKKHARLVVIGGGVKVDFLTPDEVIDLWPFAPGLAGRKFTGERQLKG